METSADKSFEKGRPVSSAPSDVSDSSMDNPVSFSKAIPRSFEKGRPVSPAPSDVSDSSMDNPVSFSKAIPRSFEKGRPVSSAPSDVSDSSMDNPVSFSKAIPRSTQSKEPVDSNVSMKSDQSKDGTHTFRRGLETTEQLTADMKTKILTLYKEKLSKTETDIGLCEIKDDKIKKTISNYSGLFKYTGFSMFTKSVRTVLTKGKAGIDKTLHTKKFMVDWAEGNSNEDIDLIVSLTFSELNSRTGDQSMKDVLNHYLSTDKQRGVSIYEKCKVFFILDSLEKCELPLDFENNKDLTDMTETASMDVLLTNLIKGKLLPSAQLWIISQPSGVQKIPSKYIHKMTECREKDANQKLTEHLKKETLKKYKKKVRQHQMDTELWDIEENKNDKQKVVQTTYNNIFNSEKVRTVLTRGEAGIGKTLHTKKFMVDWAEGNSNEDIDFIVSLTFNELNSKREDQSMKDFLDHCLSPDKQKGVSIYEKCKIVFILDGLEKCELPLDFENNKDLTHMTETASMDVLLTNLIKGKLLPSAQLWIISQPSGVDMIPSEYIQKETECRETLKRRQMLVSNLRKRFCDEYSQDEDKTHPNQKNTEHIMRDDDAIEVDDQDNSGIVKKSPKQVNSVSDIFKSENGKKVRTVLTIGEADIGKSFHMKKFIKEWAENKCSVFTWITDSVTGLIGKAEDEEIIFPLTFHELNLIKDGNVSLVGLLNHLFEETRKSVISDFAKFEILFILDRLDAYDLPLDFDKNETLTDVRQPASVNVLLTNLFKGNLLPSAQLWITSRPLGAEKLPADCLDRMTEIREKPDVASQRKLKSQLKDQFTKVSEGFDKQKTSALLNDVFTDLYIIEGDRAEVNVQSETRQVQDAKFKPMREETPIKYHDIFKPTSGENKPIRTVLTIGMAGIGKTFASMKYMLDWAEGKTCENIYYTFPLPFRELNLRKDREHSFEELLHQFFPAMETSEINDYNKYKILIVLDGFDECRLDLDFSESEIIKDMRTQTSVKVLLTNLIQGNLLPEAQIWITSRPAASNNIPPDKVDRVTEVRGFNDEQKEEYFRKRFIDKDLAEKILKHVKKSRSLYIMCHIPVFCWISSEVLEDFVNRNQEEETMPKTLTDMYIHLLLLQCRQANIKYGGDETEEGCETNSCWSERNKETVLSLAKLAYVELEKGNLLFTEEKLTECGIDITNAAVFSGLFTQIKREGRGLYQQKLFCFAHLSIQEFLAAFHAFYTFNDKGENLLTIPPSTNVDLPASDFYKTAVNKALPSKKGDWDLFLRFLLGLSLETSQNLLNEILKRTENTNETNIKTIEYIKEKIREENNDADKNLNLFYCLNELNDHSLVKEVKMYLQSETTEFEKFSTAQWSALTFVLLTSDEKLDIFDLKKYLKSEKVLLGMLPVVKVSKTTLLSWCELSEESCRGLKTSVLTTSSYLTELDLSHNDLLDSGVQLLADGLKSHHCKLEILKLSGCQVTEKGCSFLASALKSTNASPLKQLDLSYNHPGDNGVKELTEDLTLNLCFDHGGEHRLKPGLKKYGANLKFDENTAGKRLVPSEGNRKVRTFKRVEERVSQPENKDRFKRTQVLCESEEGLRGICYWEVEWKGTVGIAVTYKDVGRKWDRSGGLGCNEKSWSLLCSKTGYTAIHGKSSDPIQKPCCKKIAVFLDWEGGILRFYSKSSEKLTLIYEFKAKFKEPLFPGFWFQRGCVTLCELD